MKSSLQSFICSISNSSILLVSKILFWYRTLFSLFFNSQFKKCEKELLIFSGREKKLLVGTDLTAKIVDFGVEGFCLMRVVLLGCYFTLQFPERVYLVSTRFQVSSLFFLPLFRLFESINRLVQVLIFFLKYFWVEEWLRDGFLGIKHLNFSATSDH